MTSSHVSLSVHTSYIPVVDNVAQLAKLFLQAFKYEFISECLLSEVDVGITSLWSYLLEYILFSSEGFCSMTKEP